MTFPPDYAERVYAGVLGKIIGVYLGRPVEGWTHEQIMADLGEITYYVNDRRDLSLRNHQLVVTDDDISGTFTFLRALPDTDNSLDLTPAQIDQTWLKIDAAIAPKVDDISQTQFMKALKKSLTNQILPI